MEPPRLGQYLVFHTNHGQVYLEPRPSYCDRGRFTLKVEAMHGGVCPSCNIDGADCFPRYYFDFVRTLLEMRDWMEARSWKEIAEPELVTSSFAEP